MDIKKIRETNLLALLNGKQFKGHIGKFAESVDTDPNYISQILSPNNKAAVGHSLARKIEKKLGKIEGWMDIQHGKIVYPEFGQKAINPELLQIVIEAIDAYFGKHKEIPVTSRQKAALTNLLIEHFSGRGKLPTLDECTAKIIDVSPLFAGQG